jgi:hypothetical protein
MALTRHAKRQSKGKIWVPRDSLAAAYPILPEAPRQGISDIPRGDAVHKHPAARRQLNFTDQALPSNRSTSSSTRLGTAPAKARRPTSLAAAGLAVDAARGPREWRSSPSKKSAQSSPHAVRSPNNVEDLFAHVTAMVRGVAIGQDGGDDDEEDEVGRYLGSNSNKSCLPLPSSPRGKHAGFQQPPMRVGSSPVRPSTTSATMLMNRSQSLVMAGCGLPGGGGRRFVVPARLNQERMRKAEERAHKRECDELARSRSYAKNWVQRMQENALCANFMKD